MTNRDGYYYYEAGQAVAAAHLKLTIRHVSADPARRATDIVLSRRQHKVRMILWLTGMAAERKGVGTSDPLRRTRNRLRMRGLVETAISDGDGNAARKKARARLMLNQAQDRANAICNDLFEAIEHIAGLLREAGEMDGNTVHQVVANAKSRQLWKEDGHAPASKTRR